MSESPVSELPTTADAVRTARRLTESIESVIRGKGAEVRLVVCALTAGGHVLFDDVPGTAKTVLSRAIAQSIDGASATRIQCTPDLQPADVTGSSIYSQKTRDFEFRPGPIFTNILLLDEVNRATPKTQAALLEAMAESQVTVDGVTRPLPQPFLLLATENPVEYEGTFLLPEAELDRFFLRTSLGYPDADNELEIVRDQRHGHPLESVQPVVALSAIERLQTVAEGIYVNELLQEWIIRLVRATRTLDIVELGASVRGSIALERAVRAWALLDGREYVVPADVEALLVPVLGHRVLFTASFATDARRRGRATALREFAERCMLAAPLAG
ncbi:MAG: AAA family ATPase [Gaiellaceae bacterium]